MGRLFGPHPVQRFRHLAGSPLHHDRSGLGQANRIPSIPLRSENDQKRS
jgi:hypothetical protein